ncbi:MAG: SPFH domain-containing protein [Clostridiales bacterium]|jgi:membrane protease subunit (stomatin/prohibitin family)|nr:SPFH domain-containing protein [Clostridiales bacterium]
MAIIDIVKFDGLRNRDWLVYKHPRESLVFGTRLIVGEGQVAILIKNGTLCDTFFAGTYVLDTNNIPLLQSVINIPFGGKTPFPVEVYYINLTCRLDINWGTTNPIQLIDPKYFIKLRVRAFGKFALKIDDYKTFFTEIIGTMQMADVVSYDKVISYYKGLIVTRIKTIIADTIINQKISALEITAKLDDISKEVQKRLIPEIKKYGFTLINFLIQSINFPDEDFDQINDILEKKAAFEIMGDDYTTQRSFDVYEAAANNKGGAGVFMGAGMGAAAGAVIAKDMGAQLKTAKVQLVKCPKCKADNEAGKKFCSECGSALKLAEINCCFCGAEISENSKFCPECGESLSLKTCECGAKLQPSVKFCPECGKKLQENSIAT